MKKFYSFLVFAFIAVPTAFAGVGCVVDTSATTFLSPHPDSIACVERTVPYTTCIQLAVPDSIDLINYGAPFSFVLYVDSVTFNGFSGFPVGINGTVNPQAGVFFPGEFITVYTNGTTSDIAGHYYLVPQGTITAHGPAYPPIFDGDTTIDLATLQLMALGQLDMYLDVIEQGALCRTTAPPAVCIIDSTNTQFFSPAPDSIPCIERGVAYTQVIQIHVPNTFDIGPFVGLPPGIILLAVDSLQIDSLTGFPTGLTYELNPLNGFFLGGDNGCALASGTTNDPTGNYPLSISGTITVSGIPGGFGFPPDTTFDLAQAQSFGSMFNLSVDVINPGEECRPVSAVKDFSAELNSLVRVYPNPNNGVFTFSINAGRRINGEINVMDVSGRKVFAQPIDVNGMYSTAIDLSRFAKGLYTLQLKTAEGFASKNISIE